jgi:hypothetical protein
MRRIEEILVNLVGLAAFAGTVALVVAVIVHELG